MNIYEINNERMGDIARFGSLEDAETTLRKCGGDFKEITLRETGDGIVDQTGEVVGHVLEVVIDRIGSPFGQSGSQAEEGHRLITVHFHEENEDADRDGFQVDRVPVEAGMTETEIDAAVEKYIIDKMI